MITSRLIQPLIRFFGLVVIGSAFYYAATETAQIAAGSWLHIASLIFVVGILLGVLLTSFQVTRIMGVVRHLVLSSPSRIEGETRRISAAMPALSEAYYARGPSAVRDLLRGTSAPQVWQKLIEQLEGRIPLSDIRTLLQYDAQHIEDDLNVEIGLVSSLSSMAPSIGLLGTVVGLIRLLSGLSDISTLGPNMSLALLTALYGIFFSIVVLNPLVTRLNAVRDGLLKSYQQALFWVYLIENRKPAFYLEPAFGGAINKGER